jgi:hypothetical protein
LPIEPGRSAPRRIAQTSIVLPATFRIGRTTASWDPCPTPAASNASFVQFIARTPAVIEPPETLETRSSRER